MVTERADEVEVGIGIGIGGHLNSRNSKIRTIGERFAYCLWISVIDPSSCSGDTVVPILSRNLRSGRKAQIHNTDKEIPGSTEMIYVVTQNFTTASNGL